MGEVPDVHKRATFPLLQLLGHIDVDTREWTDGVLTSSARQVVKEPLEVQSWIVCDGDIDPEWIESLNSVLDDNRLLTMPSGERIQFGPNVNFLFESHDLSCASPATISRMGMIFLRYGTYIAQSFSDFVLALKGIKVSGPLKIACEMIQLVQSSKWIQLQLLKSLVCLLASFPVLPLLVFLLSFLPPKYEKRKRKA